MNNNVGISIEQRDKVRRVLTWVVCAAVIAGVGWTGASCLRQPQNDPRPMTTAEAQRLSRVTVNNAKAGAVAFTADLPKSAGGGAVDGRIDWSRPVMHAAVASAGDSTPRWLVQAVPGLIASREGSTDADAEVPRDGWSVRNVSSGEPSGDTAQHTSVDIMASALLTLRASRAADHEILKAKGSWLRQGTIDGATVDAFQAPLLLDAPRSKAGKVPEAVFWVDDDSRLRRIQFDPGTGDLVNVDFLLARKDVDAVHTVDLLGGDPIEPREVTKAEADTLAGLRQRNSLGGAKADLTLPVSDGEVIRAKGYVDWRTPLAYLSVDAPGKKNDGLLFVLPSGAATLTTSKVGSMPPEQPPQDGWKAQVWSKRAEDGKATEFDTLLFKLLSMTNPQNDDLKTVKDKAAWLREDALGDTATEVFELPVSGDPEAEERGQAPFRFWLGAKDDALRRIEMRTRELGMAHIDLTPQDQPQSIVVPNSVVTGLTAA